MKETSPVILLEHPRPKDPDRLQDVVNAPLSANLLSPYIAAVLNSQDIPAEILDANLMGWSMEKTLEELGKRPPKLLGVHTVYLWNKTTEVFDMLSRLRRFCPQTHINLFGFYPTFSYENILRRFPFVDSVTIGEPEYTFLELAEFLLCTNAKRPYLSLGEKNNSRSKGASQPKNVACELARTCPWQQAATLHNSLDYSGIDGLAFGINAPDGRKVIKNSPRPPISDIDSLPFPDRSHMHRYERLGIATYILGSRGCYGHCSFCYVNPFYVNDDNSSWRGRSAENIFEEIRSLHVSRGTRYFYFADANFFGPGREGKKRVSRLANLLIENELDIRFGIECRANDVEEDSLSRLVQAGLREVFLGIESGCQHILNRYKKGVFTDVNERAVETLRRFGIEPSLGFIMFEPDSRLSDIRENFEFLKKLRLLHTPAVTAHILHHRQTFFQGTPDFRLVCNKPDTKLDPVTGYEAFCEFNDPKVTAFSKVAISLCRGVLDMLQPDEADACTTTVANGRLAKINQAVIDAYDRILTAFEDGEAIRNPSKARGMRDEFLNDIRSAYKDP